MFITLKQLVELQMPLQVQIEALQQQIKALDGLILQQQQQQQQSQDGTARHSTAL